MESINQIFKNALALISQIQEASEKTRLQIECRNSREFENFILHWKQEKILSGSNHCDDESENRKFRIEQDKEGEDISSLNSLLEKARKVRSKSKVPFASPEKKIIHNKTLKPSDISGKDIRHSTVQSRALLRSQSVVVGHRNPLIPRPKSAKEQTAPSHNGSSRSEGIHRAKNTIPKTEKLNGSTVNNGVVLSKKELNELRKPVSVSDWHGISARNKTGSSLSADFSQSSNQEKYMSLKEYNDQLKGSSCLKHFCLHTELIWYPFLSSKNKNILLVQRRFAFDNLLKVVRIIHRIQEIMVWIDLLISLGKGMWPLVMVLDPSDVSTMRICRFLESIYCENLQRFPMLAKT